MQISFSHAVLVAVVIAQSAFAGKVCTAQGLGFEMRIATSSDCKKSKAWDYVPGQHLTVNTKLPKDAELVSGTWKAGAYTCDHIVELSMVKAVMEQAGGACDEAKALGNPTAAMAAIKAIAKAANAKSNLVFFDAYIESFKGKAVQYYLGTTYANTLSGMNVWELGALHDYATTREGAAATAAAAAIDAVIKAQLPNAKTGVVGKWAGWVTDVSAEWVIKEAAANKQIHQLQQQAAQAAARGTNCGTAGTSTTTKRAVAARNFDLVERSSLGHTSRLARRHLSSLEAITPVADTSIQRRGRGAARSGPHAPPAPSCPIKGAPQKKTVKRSATKVKPSKTTNARPPAKRPATRKPNPNKKVVKRPANRPRRTPGQQKQRKRITPKKKPKVVKKPARKPKGKARSRRR